MKNEYEIYIYLYTYPVNSQVKEIKLVLKIKTKYEISM